MAHYIPEVQGRHECAPKAKSAVAIQQTAPLTLEHISLPGLQGFQSVIVGTETIGADVDTIGADVDTVGATQSLDGRHVVWPVKASPGPTQQT